MRLHTAPQVSLLLKGRIDAPDADRFIGIERLPILQAYLTHEFRMQARTKASIEEIAFITASQEVIASAAD